MPHRILKDSIRTSKTVNKMTDFQYRLWTYLITYVDDYGRGSADPEIIKGVVLTRRKGVTESAIADALAALANIGSVLLYEVDGEPYFCFPNWSEHQRIQTKKSKYPAPEDGISRESTVTHRESPSESNPIQSESNPNPNTNPRESVRAVRFTPPTLEEVAEYCRERGNSVDAEHFVDYYNANGWKVGKNAMRDWKAAVRSWEKNNFADGKPAKTAIAKQSFNANEAFEKALKRSYEEESP